MRWLVAPEYSLWPGSCVLRLLGVVCLIAFASTWNQWRALCGEGGRLPASRSVRAVGLR